ncbi:MAG TPA: pyruvate ferredoxin oxidoreductase [Candidatus Cloacimonetes bacterium]|jgi:2-oxoglutarate ferredoxin oxidoreductase subunit gamma|nr:pyruvate ferredoxin oxidoreductase [Candidatus Cloacimonas sp.]HHZ15661.1 pyruvate ferredoxin oxidoreductase [Candidatus Cloacimonadota bacterium]
MKKEIICAGFGGQGVLTIGRFIAQAGMREGKHVSWLPSYGPEMRGGTANVSAVVSDQPIASPIVSTPDILVALNQPSIDKFGPQIRPGGVLVYDTGMCPKGCDRTDIQIISAPLTELAQEIGSMRVLNMIAIGMVIGRTNVIKYESMEEDLTSYLKDRDPDLLEKNLIAIKKGMELGKA